MPEEFKEFAMSVHMVWGIVGFLVAMIFVWAYYILKTRGVRFFWYHPLAGAGLLLLILYILESFFADASEAAVQWDWNLMMLLGVPLGIFVVLFLVRAALTRGKA